MKSMGGIATAQRLQKWIDERRCEHNLSQHSFGTTNAMFSVKGPHRKPEPFESSLDEIKCLGNRFSVGSSLRFTPCPGNPKNMARYTAVYQPDARDKIVMKGKNRISGA